MKALLSLLVVVMVSGLGFAQTAVPTPEGAPRAIDDMRRDDAPTWSAADKTAVASARKILEKQDGHPVDAYYKVTVTPKGRDVLVWFVTWEKNRPSFAPGGFCVVELDAKGNLIRVDPGV